MGVVGRSIEFAKDVKRAIADAKKPSNFRKLARKEQEIATAVFHDSLPYNKVVISDGLGLQGRAFTLPEGLRSSYILHVGDGYYGMSFHDADKALLIHELTHVWQGEHARWRWKFVWDSARHQARGDAYDYDANNWKDWNSYNPEQQASIVEHWFTGGMRNDDPRYPYIRYNIRGGQLIEIDLPQEPPLEASITRVQSVAYEDPRRIPCDILFGFDSARLKPAATEYLKAAVRMINENAKGKTVVIEGHTDSVGTLGYNMQLSLQRANAVKRKLIELGVDSAIKLKAKGCGETRPITPNTTPAGRQENRRVEFWYI